MRCRNRWQGDPAGHRPANTIDIGAWVEVLPFQIDAALPEADLSGKIGFNVFRGLSLSPDDVRTVIDLIAIHYLSGEEISNFRDGFRGTLDRYQKEVIATRVSAANECFYCTSGHAAMLSTSVYQTKNEIIDMTGLDGFRRASCRGGAEFHGVDRLLRRVHAAR